MRESSEGAKEIWESTPLTGKSEGERECWVEAFR